MAGFRRTQRLFAAGSDPNPFKTRGAIPDPPIGRGAARAEHLERHHCL
jgi:hypothetical protein